jgi:hypothetical protein
VQDIDIKSGTFIYSQDNEIEMQGVVASRFMNGFLKGHSNKLITILKSQFSHFEISSPVF